MRDLLAGLPEIGTVPPDSTPSTLVLHSMREAFFYARKCCRGKLQDDEIYSACYEALCEAARNFIPGGSIRFFGYAKQYIRGRSGLVKVWRSKDVVRNKKGEFSTNYINLPLEEPAQWAEELNGLELPEGEGGITETIAIQKGKLKSVAPTVEFEIESVQIREEYELLKPMFKQLTDKEQSVIALRYRSGLTFERIGALLGTSPADSQVTHARALKKLRRLAKPKLGTIK